jgi:hypothetical protein
VQLPLQNHVGLESVELLDSPDTPPKMLASRQEFLELSFIWSRTKAGLSPFPRKKILACSHY